MTPALVAILTSTVLTDGTFTCRTVDFPESLHGVPHYVGHPGTRAVVEALGAHAAAERLFAGLAVGETYLAVPLAQNARPDGVTVEVAVDTTSQLTAKLVTRIA